MYKITPSMMTCDLLNLRQELQQLIAAGIKWIHFDLMDGKFVNNLGLCPNSLQAIKKEFPQLVIDAHCMVNELKKIFNTIKTADYITIHLNSDQKEPLQNVIAFIKSFGIKVGIGFGLNNKIEQLDDLINDIDLITIMSITPGFAGQVFSDGTWNTIFSLRKYVEQNNHKVLLQIDGGVRWNNIKQLIDAQLDLIVVGSLLFSTPNYQATLDKIKKL